MGESVTSEESQAIYKLKNNRSGNLKLKNGRLAVDTGTDTYYTTIVGDQDFGNEAVGGDEEDQLRKAESHPTATGDLYLSNGYLYLTNYTGKVTLVDG
ncbi:MAG: hypothetical protein SVS85_02350 [Candidatus Nanohaloarchaea archaeon]|nr:hypothetical protein [Candidatus Nanohaloarchaea archaeon]